MTSSAREVLEDCRQAVLDIKDGVMGRQWRIRWAAAVTLLRAVGHVLRNVDREMDALMREIVDEEWKKPKPKIFQCFIEKSRNNIVKEYKMGAGQGVTVRPGTMYINLRTGYQSCGPSGVTRYHYTINEGRYKGRDQREVLQEAIDWWETYLDGIDREYQLRKIDSGSFPEQ